VIAYNGGFHASAVWLDAVADVLKNGRERAPRGMRTLEIPHRRVDVDLSHPVVLVPARKLSYAFLAAEALWILAGDDRVETIAPYNPNIAKFSDDGVRFAGAYGAPIVAQFDYVVGKLLDDRDTRQAVMTIWRPNPPPSKDIPCTVAIGFDVYGGRLNCHVTMRSSDLWLGLPYDVFTFSMLAAKVACVYNNVRRTVDGDETTAPGIELGWLHLTAWSSHLYARDFEAAKSCVDDGVAPRGNQIPDTWVRDGRWDSIEESVAACRDKSVADFHWRIRP
jgi:thymidylate synthase